MDKKRLIYLGLGALVLLVAYNSTRKIQLKEIVDPTVTDKKQFDSSFLPNTLKPPYMLAEGEEIRTASIKKSITGISFKPRFDR